MKNIEYCERSVDICEEIFNKGIRHISYQEGIKMAGIHWTSIAKELSETGGGYFEYGDFTVTKTGHILKFYSDINMLLGHLKKEEYDRELSNTHKIENIKYGKRGYILSIIAIIISSLALLKEIAIRLFHL